MGRENTEKQISTLGLIFELELDTQIAQISPAAELETNPAYFPEEALRWQQLTSHSTSGIWKKTHFGQSLSSTAGKGRNTSSTWHTAILYSSRHAPEGAASATSTARQARLRAQAHCVHLCESRKMGSCGVRGCLPSNWDEKGDFDSV